MKIGGVRVGELLERRMLLDLTPVVYRHGPKVARALLWIRGFRGRPKFELCYEIGSQVRR